MSLLNTYARLLIDNHITEDDPSFITCFDPEQYVAMVKKGGFDAAMVYATCHNGNCYYPSRVAHMHQNLHGRDIFGETVALLRKNGITPQAYHTVIYQRRYAREHPDWRVTYSDGTQSYRRSWYNCLNNRGYLEFAQSQIREIVAYDIDSIFIDMTFWPSVCVCHSCREKYRRQYQREIPEIIDWNNPEWVNFQRARRQWLSDFAHKLTDTAKTARPGILVTHQSSPVLLGWCYGQSSAMIQACDYTSGDFYGDKNQQRLGTKVLAALSKNTPFEFMTSRCVNLYDHTSTKSQAELTCSAATTLANGGAYFFIDAINPDGTLNPQTYERLGRIAHTLKPFKNKLAALKPVLQADTALYFSMTSHVNQQHNHLRLKHLMDPANNMNPSTDLPPLKELLGTSVILNRAKIPYRIITDLTTDFTGLRALVLNDTAFLSAEETARIREFVRTGGTLIATGMSSFYDLQGQSSGDFSLRDVFGLSFTGKYTRRVHYLKAPDNDFVFCNRPAPIVKAASAEILAGIAEPLFDPDDFDHFASYHSDPPGPLGEHPALTLNRFGRGTCLYLACSLLAMQHDAQQQFAQALFTQHLPPSMISTNAPPCIEITLLKATIKNALLVCLVNYQQELPNIPIYDLEFSLQLPTGFMGQSFRTVSGNDPTTGKIENGRLLIKLHRLETMEMIEIE